MSDDTTVDPKDPKTWPPNSRVMINQGKTRWENGILCSLFSRVDGFCRVNDDTGRLAYWPLDKTAYVPAKPSSPLDDDGRCSIDPDDRRTWCRGLRVILGQGEAPGLCGIIADPDTRFTAYWTVVNDSGDVSEWNVIKTKLFIGDSSSPDEDDEPGDWPIGQVPLNPALPSSSPDEDEPDMVVRPGHYTWHPSGVECRTIAEPFGFNLGNAIVHIWRAGRKDKSAAVEDLRHAREYIGYEIARLESEAK